MVDYNSSRLRLVYLVLIGNNPPKNARKISRKNMIDFARVSTYNR